MFRTLGHANLAAIAIVAALYHTLNHAIFKGLLFLAAGSVVQSMHTRNMDDPRRAGEVSQRKLEFVRRGGRAWGPQQERSLRSGNLL
jgi:NADH:ubiquinone oxidoreductase subunit 5 (subunit L)/multisubunit Na+/H+ antiporter MnhA subunit